MSSTELAVIEPGSYPVLAQDLDDVREIIDDVLDGDILTERDLPRVIVPAGGGTTWEVGTESIRELDGILIHTVQTRSYWPHDAEDGTPPACSSRGPDHKAIGTGTPGGPCSECPLAEFGSALDDAGQPGAGQACAKNELWFMLRQSGVGTFLPVVVKFPPTSVQAAGKYRKGVLGSAGLRKTAVVTRLTLSKQEKGRESYSIIVPTVAGNLSPEEAARAQAFAADLRPVLEDAAAAEADGRRGEPVPVTPDGEPDVTDEAGE